MSADARDAQSLRQVDELFFELKDALEALRQALKSPAPPEVAEDEDASPVDLL